MRVRIEFGRFERRYTQKKIVTLSVHTDAQPHTDTRTSSQRHDAYYYMENSTRDFTSFFFSYSQRMCETETQTESSKGGKN